MSAESPSPPPPSPPPEAAAHHWCYHCDKRVTVETQSGEPNDIICNECKFGFVESIPTTTSSSSTAAILSPPNEYNGISDEPTLGSQFLQVLRLLAQVAREDDAPPPPPRRLNHAGSSPDDDSDFLRIEIDAWDEDERNNRDIHLEEEDEEVDHEEDDDVRSVEIEGQSDEDEVEEREEDIRRRRRDVLRLRLRDFANRAHIDGPNRMFDWAEILMGLEDNSIEFPFGSPVLMDRYTGTPVGYVGNPGDYVVNAAEYEALLQNLADAEGRRGAPPAAKAAVEKLREVVLKTVDETYVCAICKDVVNVGEFVKEMPCGHGYHGDCIVPWLEARNSCPVCRFELPTDDTEYEEDKKKRFSGSSSGTAGGNSV